MTNTQITEAINALAIEDLDGGIGTINGECGAGVANRLGELDAIYVMDLSDSSPSASACTQLEDDLGIIIGQDSIGFNLEWGVDHSPYLYVEGFDLVGKIGLGDMEISDDETTRIMMTLLIKTVYAIDISTKTTLGIYPMSNPMCIDRITT